MKGYHFFIEYPDQKSRRKATRKNLGDHSGNVIAVPLPQSWIPGKDMVMECYSAAYNWANSGVCGSQCSRDYLRSQCLRISEAVAREIHPKMFTYLES